MKLSEQIKAKELRKQGMSIGSIAEKLAVSKSSVSLWTKEIVLTEKQLEKLKQDNPILNNQMKGAMAMKEKHRLIRQDAQAKGKKKASENDPLHIMGCMLYWGEGNKYQRNSSVGLSNSDPALIKTFYTFLVETMNVEKHNILLSCQWYSDNGLTEEEVQDYWITLLGLDKKCLRSFQKDNISAQSKSLKFNRNPYGTARIMVHSVTLLHEILGAIQEYGEFENPSWVQ